MPKEPKVNIEDLAGGQKRENGLKIYYTYQKKYVFSLPAFELDDSGTKFRLDEKGQKIPQFRFDANGNNKTRVRKTFEFEEVPKVDPVTGKISATVWRARLTIDKTNPYYEDVVKYLDDLADIEHSLIWSEVDFVENERPDAFKMAVVKKEVEDKYKAEIDDLRAKVAKLEGRK